MPDDKTEACSSTDYEDNDFDDELPIRQGILSKWTNYIHGWQERYIVLKLGTLSYYRSESDFKYGCRGAVSLGKAIITPHEFDDCRFDVSVNNDSIWYLRADNSQFRDDWIDDLGLHKKEINKRSTLQRRGSLLSLASGTSSFKQGQGLREKLAEIDTFRDILSKQVEGLQNYFDACASAVQHGVIEDCNDIDEPVDTYPVEKQDLNGHYLPTTHTFVGFNSYAKNSRDIASILNQHGAHAMDFKGEAHTFKATACGIISNLSHCIEMMNQREEAWRKRFEREREGRKKYQQLYKVELEKEQSTKHTIFNSPDYEEGPYSKLKDEEFYDAVEAALDNRDKEDEIKQKQQHNSNCNDQLEKPLLSLTIEHPLYDDITKCVQDHIKYADLKGVKILSESESDWKLIAEDGEMKVYTRELEENGVVLDPIRAVHSVNGITGHELCHYFWDPSVRMEWETTLEESRVLEFLSNDTVITFQLHKRIWPSAQRDSLFWSSIQHYQPDVDRDEDPEYWIVVSKTVEHVQDPKNSKWIRIRFNASLICETIANPSPDGNLTRDNISCKVQYSANINPGGWAPAAAVRALSKREIPKFLKTFTKYVQEKVKDRPILR